MTSIARPGGCTPFARCAAAIVLSFAVAAAAAADVPVEQRVGGDVFVAGSAVTVSDAVAGDLFATGGSIDVDAPVAGDVVAMGGKLRLGADVGRSVYAAGGQLSINANVRSNARVAGGQIEFGPKSTLAGNLTVAGGQVRLRGSVSGQVQIAGGRVLIDGPVGGDVVAGSGQLELGPNARIAGRLRYRGGEALRQDPAAQVAGGIDRLPGARAGAASAAGDGRAAHRSRMPVGLWSVGLMLLAALLVAVLPNLSERVSRSLRERTGWSVLLGFIVLVCVPIAALLLMITLIGLPIGLAGIAIYLALLPIAYVAAAIGIGAWGLQRFAPARAAAPGWRIVAACLVVLLLALLGAVPWLGGVVSFVVLLAGIGAIALLWTTPRAADMASMGTNPTPHP